MLLRMALFFLNYPVRISQKSCRATPTGLEICTCHRGSCHYKVRMHGLASHAARPQKGVNAIEKAVKALKVIEAYSEQLKLQTHEFLDARTITPTTIHAGIQDNMVPDVCEIVVDARIFPGETAKSVLSPLCDRLDKLAEEDSEFFYDIEITQEALGGEVPKDSPLVCAASTVYHEAFSKFAVLKGFEVTCEQSFLIHAGIPTIIFGPGDCSLAHTPDEHVQIRDVEYAYRYYYALAKYLLT